MDRPTDSVIDRSSPSSRQLGATAAKFLLILALASACAFYAYIRLDRPRVGVDDANIFMVYAQHVSQGQGFVYNVGGEHVEGFSSLLYVLILSVFHAVWDHPERVALLFNLLIVSAALTMVVAHLDRVMDSAASRAGGRWPFLSPPSLLLVAWTLSSPAYMSWTTLTLMDTGLWSSLLLVGSVILSRSGATSRGGTKAAFCLLTLVLVLARPEAMLWAPVMILVFGLLAFLRTRSLRAALRSVVAPFVVFAVAVSALTLFRMTYFGFPLPNTYYAKVSPDAFYTLTSGLTYAYGFVSSSALVRLAVFAAAMCLVGLVHDVVTKERVYSAADHYWATVTVLTAAGLLVPVLVGGDHFRWFRLYQPIWPLLILPLYRACVVVIAKLPLGAAAVYPPWLRYLAAGAILLGFSLDVAPCWYDFSEPSIAHEFRIAKRGRHIGETLNDVLGDGTLPTIGVITAGGVTCTYRGFVHDLMGLNSVAMGHHPGDRHGLKNHAAFSKEVFYSLRPQLVVPTTMPAASRQVPHDKQWLDRVLDGLLDDPAFTSTYTYAVIHKPADTEALCAFVRNDYLRSLKTRPLRVRPCRMSAVEQNVPVKGR